MADDSNLPAPGDILAGKYRIERLIGRGGMGAVFAAQHLLLNQRVALKLLLGELAGSNEASARFLNEARAAAQIRGEHVARVLDIGQLENGAPFMVLEYLEGSDLSGVLQQRGPLPVAEVADYAIQALDALAQAHAAGIVHRDLKPANLFLARRHDGTALVKVLDFGISKNLSSLNGVAPQGMTSTRAVLGSPEYMSPEQLRTPRAVDTRTDIWSLGVILYELLTGEMPFKGESLAELFVSILETTPAAIRSIRPDVPPSLEAIVHRCMVRDPNGRFPHVGELAAALMVFASEQTRAMAAARGSAPGLMGSGASQPPLASHGHVAVTANTAGTWANTGAARQAPRTRVVAILGASLLALCVGVVAIAAVVSRVAKSEPASAASVASAAATSAPPSATTIAPLAVPAASTRDAGATAVVPRPPPATPVTPAPPKKDPNPAPPRPVTPAPPPPAKNCAPDYYFDKDGNKHFKPECFQ